MAHQMDAAERLEVKRKLRNARKKKKTLTYQEFNEVFDLYDSDKNGRLQYCEINNFMKDMLLRIDRTRRSHKEGLTEKEMLKYAKDVKKLIEKYDVDKSGTLDRSEVAKILNVKIPANVEYQLDTPVKSKIGLFEQAEDVCLDQATEEKCFDLGGSKAEEMESEDEHDKTESVKTESAIKQLYRGSSTEIQEGEDNDTLPPLQDGEVDYKVDDRRQSELLRKGALKLKLIRFDGALADSESGNEPLLSQTNKQAWQFLQKKTFNDWVETRLEENGSTYKVTNLIENLGDGILLPELVNSLLKKQIKYNKNPKLTFHRYENIHICLDALKSRGCGFSMDVAGDLVSGNEKLCLSFMKTVVGHFGTKAKKPMLLDLVSNLSFAPKSTKLVINATPVPQPEEEPALPMPDFPPPTQKKESFLGHGNQARVRLKPMSIVIPQFKPNITYGATDIVTQVNKLLQDLDVSIKNLTDDWTDGRIILCLAEQFCRGILPSYTHDHALVKIGIAFTVLNELLDINTEVTPMDMYKSRCNISNFKYYLSQIIYRDIESFSRPFKRSPSIMSKEKELRNVGMISESLKRKQKLALPPADPDTATPAPDPSEDDEEEEDPPEAPPPPPPPPPPPAKPPRSPKPVIKPVIAKYYQKAASVDEEALLSTIPLRSTTKSSSISKPLDETSVLSRNTAKSSSISKPLDETSVLSTLPERTPSAARTAKVAPMQKSVATRSTAFEKEVLPQITSSSRPRLRSEPQRPADSAVAGNRSTGSSFTASNRSNSSTPSTVSPSKSDAPNSGQITSPYSYRKSEQQIQETKKKGSVMTSSAFRPAGPKSPGLPAPSATPPQPPTRSPPSATPPQPPTRSPPSTTPPQPPTRFKTTEHVEQNTSLPTRDQERNTSLPTRDQERNTSLPTRDHKRSPAADKKRNDKFARVGEIPSPFDDSSPGGGEKEDGVGDNDSNSDDQEQINIQYNKNVSKMIASFIDTEETIKTSPCSSPDAKRIKKKVRFNEQNEEFAAKPLDNNTDNVEEGNAGNGPVPHHKLTRTPGRERTDVNTETEQSDHLDQEPVNLIDLEEAGRNTELVNNLPGSREEYTVQKSLEEIFAERTSSRVPRNSWDSVWDNSSEYDKIDVDSIISRSLETVLAENPTQHPAPSLFDPHDQVGPSSSFDPFERDHLPRRSSDSLANESTVYGSRDLDSPRRSSEFSNLDSPRRSSEFSNLDSTEDEEEGSSYFDVIVRRDRDNKRDQQRLEPTPESGETAPESSSQPGSSVDDVTDRVYSQVLRPKINNMFYKNIEK